MQFELLLAASKSLVPPLVDPPGLSDGYDPQGHAYHLPDASAAAWKLAVA